MADHANDGTPEGDPGSGAHARPDYDLEPTLEVSGPAGLKAIADPLRARILALLVERAATTTELADALGRPKGTVGYHLQVLAEAGLVRIVRTEQVRAITAKYYGRTARTFVITGAADEVLAPHFMLHEAMAEWVEDEVNSTTLRHARIPVGRAAEWNERLLALAEEFAAQDPGGRSTYGLLVALYRTDRPGLADPGDEGDR